MKQGDIVYYTDELHDEIIDFKIKRIKIDEHYKYLHSNPFHKLCSFITYRILATPITKTNKRIFTTLNHLVLVFLAKLCLIKNFNLSFI